MTQIDQLAGPALVRAYNELAEIRQIKKVARFSDRKAGAVRVEASLSIVAETHDVTIGEDGAVTATLRGKASSIAAGQPTAAPASGPTETAVEPLPQSDRRVSPGLARLEKNLGTEGAAALRDQVNGDGQAALAEAARRTDAPLDDATRAELAKGAAAIDALGDKPVSATGAKLPTDRVSLDKLLSRTTDPIARDEIRAALAALPAAAPAAPRPARDAAPAPRASTGRPPSVSDTDVILVKLPGGKNPKRAVAADRFGKYTNRMTVAEYIRAITPLCGNSADTARKQAMRDLAWDAKQGWVEIVGAKTAAKTAAAQPAPAPAEAAEAKA